MEFPKFYEDHYDVVVIGAALAGCAAEVISEFFRRVQSPITPAAYIPLPERAYSPVKMKAGSHP